MVSENPFTNLQVARRSPPTLSGAFYSLPIELNKAIAHYLDTDKDIFTFQLVCRSTNDAVNADNGSFWRARFRQMFAMRGDLSNEELKVLYKRRKKYLRVGQALDVIRGNRQREWKLLETLRDLINESFSDGAEGDEHDRLRCKNQLILKSFVYKSKLLIGDRRTSASPAKSQEPDYRRLLAAIRIMCSHFLFESDTPKHHIYAFEQSQYAVYLSTNAAPIYEGANLTSVNFPWVFHCLQFFRYHMTSEAAATLYGTVEELSPMARPFAWQSALQNGTYPLGKHWKGTYAYLESHEVRKLRKSSMDEIGEDYLCDKNVDEGKIQTLELDFVNGNEPLPWPRLFENRLHSLRNTGSTQLKTQGRIKPAGTCNIQFTGQGVDLEDDFNTMGWLNPLPAQEGIPGWQRITFMKHFIDDFDQIEQDNLWAYEGVVLPGGRIILGRWWYASEQVDFNNDYNGPFILWAVDEASEF